MDIREEVILGKKVYGHWYYVSKGRAITRFLGDTKVPEVLDVGAGSGIFARQLIDQGICDSAICIDSHYAEDWTEQYHGRQIRFVRTIDASSQMLVLMADVLEHVPDDVALLKTYADRLPAGGQLLITVPAFQFLWSGHDVFLEHHRRYTAGTLEAVVRKAGMVPVKSRYFFASLFLPLAAVRLVKKTLFNRGLLTARSELKPFPNWLNNTLIAVHDAERYCIFGLNKFFGLSVFCLCRKG